MLFVKTNDLKAGMRLARPVYNRHGVLLYERDSKLSVSAINSIRNFGLLGIRAGGAGTAHDGRGC